MPLRRNNFLLFLLVVTPLALLTWLATYLIRDAARSTDMAMQAVLAERMAVADRQMAEDMAGLTDELDDLGEPSAPPETRAGILVKTLAAHPWMMQVWTSDSQGEVTTLQNLKDQTYGQGDDAASRARSLTLTLRKPVQASPAGAGPFHLLPLPEGGEPDRSRRAVWMTFARVPGHAQQGLVPQQRTRDFFSGWHVTDGDFIYWRKLPQGELVCARLDSRTVRQALYNRLPPPGLQPYAGRLVLMTRSGIPLHTAGDALEGSESRPAAMLSCSPPLSQWQMGYSPAAIEFPKPYLFPILLGVGSGCLLVLALAWIFFQENARELRLAQQRVSFVNQISHELKTPLTNIQLYTEMAAQRIEDAGDAIATRHLGVVERETSRLNRLIQNVLNYARQQKDRLSVHPQPIVLDEVVSRAAGTWRAILENKGFKVILSLNGPPMMKADADAVEQILSNLLSNVDKYAAHGKWVSITTETAGESARILVEDRGPGIPSSKRRMVFEPFERLRSDLNEGVSGTGIGLTISRELADLHGGSLEVCSHHKDGARFILTLPLQPTCS